MTDAVLQKLTLAEVRARDTGKQPKPSPKKGKGGPRNAGGEG
jgi:hypothetical protein